MRVNLLNQRQPSVPWKTRNRTTSFPKLKRLELWQIAKKDWRVSRLDCKKI